MQQQVVVHTYKDARHFNREAAKMTRAGWFIGGQSTDRKGNMLVTWVRNPPVHPPSPAYYPPPPQLPPPQLPPPQLPPPQLPPRPPFARPVGPPPGMPSPQIRPAQPLQMQPPRKAGGLAVWQWVLLIGLILFIGVPLVFIGIGFAFPAFIIGAIVLLGLAFRSPDTIVRITASRPMRWLPKSLRFRPMRFAVIFAAIIIPVSALAGTYVYDGLPGQEQAYATATVKQGTTIAGSTTTAIAGVASQATRDAKSAQTSTPAPTATRLATTVVRTVASSESPPSASPAPLAPTASPASPATAIPTAVVVTPAATVKPTPSGPPLVVTAKDNPANVRQAADPNAATVATLDVGVDAQIIGDDMTGADGTTRWVHVKAGSADGFIRSDLVSAPHVVTPVPPTPVPPTSTPTPAWSSGVAVTNESVRSALGATQKYGTSLDPKQPINVKVDTAGGGAEVDYKIVSSLSETDTLTIASWTTYSVMRSLFSNPTVQSVTVNTFADWQDSYGKTASEVTTTALFKRTTVNQKIDWAGLQSRVTSDNKLIFCIADYDYVHPGIVSRLKDRGCLALR